MTKVQLQVMMPRQQKEPELDKPKVSGPILGNIRDCYMLKICQSILHQNMFETKMPSLPICLKLCQYRDMHVYLEYETLSNYLNYLAMQWLNDMFNDPTLNL